MQDNLIKKQTVNSDYYQDNQAQFYRMARIRQQQEVLNKMQQTYESYSTATNSEKNNVENQPAKQDLDDKTYNNKQQKHNSGGLDLGNIANMLGGNADFSKILLNALSGQNKDIGNILKIINNPLVKNSLSKKAKPVQAQASGDEIESTNEIDSFEKIQDN